MSTGVPCTCKTPKKERRANWVVRDRLCNYSAFNGYRRTPSDYSLVICLVCSGLWRTKAEYVSTLSDEGRFS